MSEEVQEISCKLLPIDFSDHFGPTVVYKY